MRYEHAGEAHHVQQDAVADPVLARSTSVVNLARFSGDSVDLVKVVFNLKSHLQILELLRDEPSPNKESNDQRTQQRCQGVERKVG